MVQIEWDPRAIEDLAVIHAFIAKDSPRNAETYIARLIGRIERLRDWPGMGSTKPDFPDPNLKQIVYGVYRIIYLHEEAQVTIIKIHHGARLLDPDAIRPRQ